MTALILPIAERFTLGGVLSLVIPLGVLIVVAIWYVVLLRRGSDEA